LSVSEQILGAPIGELAEKQRAASRWTTGGVPTQSAQDAAVYRCERELFVEVRQHQVSQVGGSQRDPPVAARQRPATDPADLTGNGELVEQGGGVAGQPGRE
jgi:hypothetical protein